jgi:glyoxylase-like metal-dependent hydrolase (beta-lactamase superfamily II)
MAFGIRRIVWRDEMKSLLLAFAALSAAFLPVATEAQEQPAASVEEAQAPGFYRIMLGDFKVIALTDGTTPVPFGDLLQGESRAKLAATFKDAGEPMERETSINSFLIDTGDHRILIDAGSGRLFGDCCGRLPETLRAAGYTARSIDIVLLTHVHGDHSGGLTVNGQRVFPNAEVYLAKSEFDYWMSDAAKAHAKASHQKMFEEGRAALAPYVTAGRIRTFDAPSTLLPGIVALPAAGHTPGHTFFEIASREHRMRVVGDIIHAAEIQLPQPGITIDFDVDEALAAKTRRTALTELSDTHELVAAEHISFPGLGHFTRDGEGFAWAPIPYSTVVRELGK